MDNIRMGQIFFFVEIYYTTQPLYDNNNYLYKVLLISRGLRSALLMWFTITMTTLPKKKDWTRH